MCSSLVGAVTTAPYGCAVMHSTDCDIYSTLPLNTKKMPSLMTLLLPTTIICYHIIPQKKKHKNDTTSAAVMIATIVGSEPCYVHRA